MWQTQTNNFIEELHRQHTIWLETFFGIPLTSSSTLVILRWLYIFYDFRVSQNSFTLWVNYRSICYIEDIMGTFKYIIIYKEANGHQAMKLMIYDEDACLFLGHVPLWFIIALILVCPRAQIPVIWKWE